FTFFPYTPPRNHLVEDKRIQWADGFVLVYSICDRASFNSVQPKVQFIKAAKEGPSQEKVPIVIVGNKRDLHHRRVVSSEEGRLLALSMDCRFYEVSASEAYHGALVVFHSLAECICEAKTTLKKGTVPSGGWTPSHAGGLTCRGSLAASGLPVLSTSPHFGFPQCPRQYYAGGVKTATYTQVGQVSHQCCGWSAEARSCLHGYLCIIKKMHTVSMCSFIHRDAHFDMTAVI
uniref:small monomeric GTPase n=1 Tax=Varanus komodoensis TaxID=61221 RepID=A0A8D2LV75_VARKO